MFENIGATLKSHRLASGWSQTECAEHVGTVQSHVAHIENGKKLPSILILLNISKVVGISTDALLGNSDLSDRPSADLLDMTGLSESDKSHIIALVKSLQQNRLGSSVRRDGSEDSGGSETGVVYFISAASMGAIKIGYSRDFKTRLASLSTSIPFGIEVLATVPGSFVDENALHRQFSHLRLHGEWFTDTHELRQFIETLK